MDPVTSHSPMTVPMIVVDTDTDTVTGKVAVKVQVVEMEPKIVKFWFYHDY